jgi:uncharacterized SAM-binding protein YcdF (DUF218 family)
MAAGDAPADEGQRRPALRRRRWVWALGVLTALVVAFAAVAIVLVTNPRDDTPADPDVIVVLGGFGQERADLGIELAERFDVPLLLSSSAAHFGTERGYRCGREAICLEPAPESTAGEARDVAELMAERGWERTTVVTSSHHTARARILFRQCLGHRVSVIGADRPGGVRAAEQATEVAGFVAALTVRRAC